MHDRYSEAPDMLLYCPGGQGPPHSAVSRPSALPIFPGGQRKQSFSSLAPGMSRYRPRGHKLEHMLVVKPSSSPYRPRGQNSQPSMRCPDDREYVPSPGNLYCPLGHVMVGTTPSFVTVDSPVNQLTRCAGRGVVSDLRDRLGSKSIAAMSVCAPVSVRGESVSAPAGLISVPSSSTVPLRS